jgi:pimeloyl-ACP methyl ester carboxylesterase
MELEILRVPAKDRPATGGSRPRPPLLFVHGSYGSAQVWAAHFLEFFSANAYDCHAFSFRGHGASEGMLSWSGLADYGEDLSAMIDSMAEKPVLIGHSMGGLVVQHALAKHDIAAALLLATVPPSGVSSSAMHLSMFAPDILWQLGLLQSLGPEAVSREVMARAFLAPNPSTASIDRLMSGLQRCSPRAAAELLAPSLPTPPRRTKPKILVLGGDADQFLPVAAFRETAIYFDAGLKIIPGMPHLPMLDERFWQPAALAILSFLAELPNV